MRNNENRVHILPVTNRRISRKRNKRSPTDTQRRWLSCGVNQAGGKLPLFDDQGQRFNEKTIRSCLTKGWAEPWFENPLMPDWLVCRLTEAGRLALVSE